MSEICDRALKLTSQIREYIIDATSEEKRLSSDFDQKFTGADNDSERTKIWHEKNAKLGQLAAQKQFDYESKFKIDSILIRKALLSISPKKIIVADRIFERPMIPRELNSIADNLEYMAKYLLIRYDKLSYDDLKAKSGDLINKLRNFAIKWSNLHNNIMSSRSNYYFSDLVENKRIEYLKDYKIDSIIMRDELLVRLGEEKRNEKTQEIYEFPASSQSIMEVADDIERLAKIL